jgi:hypothetical protein
MADGSSFQRDRVFQAAEAGERASRFNRTAGIAMIGGAPLALPSILTQFLAYPPIDGFPTRPRWAIQNFASVERELFRKNSEPLTPRGYPFPRYFRGSRP